MTQEQRFWEKVKKGNPNECWEWLAATNDRGYGKMFSIYKKRVDTAHRISWEIHNGAIPSELCVLHRCDNPLCVNPSHLFLGTMGDNMRDMHRKGRGKTGAKGELHGNSKLTEPQVREIFRLSEIGWLNWRIAKYYSVKDACISKILYRQTWKHLKPKES